MQEGIIVIPTYAAVRTFYLFGRMPFGCFGFEAEDLDGIKCK